GLPVAVDQAEAASMGTPEDHPGEALLAAARRLAPAIRAARDDIERQRGLPAALVAAMHEAELFRLYIPRSLAGLEVDPIPAMDVVETVAMADGAAGWTLMIGST